MGFRAALPIAERFFRHKHIYRSNSHLAAERSQKLVATLARGEAAYLAGISIGGFHNTGAALVEVTAADGLRVICNNEEERFSGRKHASTYPSASLEALTEIMKDLGIGPDRIVAWLATYDYPLFIATAVRSLLEEFPASLGLVFQDHRPTFGRSGLDLTLCRRERDHPGNSHK
jgi:carbamoyltransferase